MRSGILLEQLEDICRRDPDGGERQPTDADHAAHKAWAIALYGADVWEIYSTHNWAEPEV